MLKTREQALKHYLKEMADERSNTPNGTSATWHHQVIRFLEDKAASNNALLDIYTGRAGEDRRRLWYDASRVAWTVHLPATLSRLEDTMVGPFALGDDLVSTKNSS